MSCPTGLEKAPKPKNPAMVPPDRARGLFFTQLLGNSVSCLMTPTVPVQAEPRLLARLTTPLMISSHFSKKKSALLN